MQHDWFMYHLRSTYKNRLDFPFKVFGPDQWWVSIFSILNSKDNMLQVS